MELNFNLQLYYLLPNIFSLQDVTTCLPEWENGHFYLAKYYDKVMPTVTENKMEKQGDLIKYIVIHFGRLVQ